MPQSPSHSSTESSSEQSENFRVRARVEANRYGPDPWIFVRELLQNARDANATTVDFVVQEDSQGLTIRCQDNGEGMDFDHARRYLFSLYSSSKENTLDQIGRFGVGFWSILRFDPEQIIIRSSTQFGQPWQICLDGDLRRAKLSHPEKKQSGTEIILYRSSGDGSHDRRVFDAAQQNGRFLCLRDDPTHPLKITVNGQRINRPFSLPPPSLTFHRSKVRGVVALGQTPGVELFSQGLRVRSAACLDDLLSSQFSATHSRVRFAELPDTLAPRILLESNQLDLVLSRNEARESRALRRLVSIAQHELQRLVDRQLETILPPTLFERFVYRMRHILHSFKVRPNLAITVLISACCILLFGISSLFWTNLYPSKIDVAGIPTTSAVDSFTNSEYHNRSASLEFQDLQNFYDGPQVSEIENRLAISLSYDPPHSPVFFRVLTIRSISKMADESAKPTQIPYQGTTCRRNGNHPQCMKISFMTNFRSGALRLPIPTGYALDETSVRLPSSLHPVMVTRSEAFEPVVMIDSATTGPITYFVAPGLEAKQRHDSNPPPALPADFMRQAHLIESIEDLPSKISYAIRYIRKKIRYDRSAAISQRHEAARSQQLPFINRAISIGAGDCDVQNGVLTALLQHAGLDARLVIGYVGQKGEVNPLLHAWTEVRSDRDDAWKVADATPPNQIVPSIAHTPLLPTIQTKARPIHNSPISRQDLAIPSSPPPSIQNPDQGLPSVTDDDSNHNTAQSPSFVRKDTKTELLSATTPTWLPSPELRWYTAILAGLACLTLMLYSFISRSRQQKIDLDPQVDLTGMLQGVFRQPDSLRMLPALSFRKLIPKLDGKKLSLQHAREHLAHGQLYCAKQCNLLTDIFQRRGGTVIDTQSDTGRLVAETLGAINLDEWMDLIAKHRQYPIVDALNSYLLEHHHNSAVVAGDHANQFITVLNLPRIELWRDQLRLSTRRQKKKPANWRRISNIVLVNSKDKNFLTVAREFTSRPQTALYWLLEHVSSNLDLDHHTRSSLLVQQASAAINEQAQL